MSKSGDYQRYGKVYYQRHREEIRARYQANRVKILERMRVSGATLRKAEKETVFEHYGHRCVCCGEDVEEFLTIDHVNGGGRRFFRATNGHVYRALIRDGFPRDIQILCMNCNFGRRLTGVCPHQQGKL